jgi:hypothetical protein
MTGEPYGHDLGILDAPIVELYFRHSIYGRLFVVYDKSKIYFLNKSGRIIFTCRVVELFELYKTLYSNGLLDSLIQNVNIKHTKYLSYGKFIKSSVDLCTYTNAFGELSLSYFLWREILYAVVPHFKNIYNTEYGLNVTLY